jgi:hypothetical protein
MTSEAKIRYRRRLREEAQQESSLGATATSRPVRGLLVCYGPARDAGTVCRMFHEPAPRTIASARALIPRSIRRCMAKSPNSMSTTPSRADSG